MEMKYVVVKSKAGEQMVIFPKNIYHDALAETLSYVKHGTGREWERFHREPVSAGFTDGVTCYGRSESLNLDSRTIDTMILRNGGKG